MRRFFLLLFTPCLLVSCAPQPLVVTRQPATVRLVAADSCEPLAEALVAKYEESHPWVTVPVEVYNNTLAGQILQAGDADAALLSWLEDENELWSRPFAEDSIAVIAHPATPLTEVSLSFLQEIYRGRVQEWEGMVLAVVSREDGSGTRAAFDGAILQGRDITLTAVVMVSNEAVIEYVAQTPGGIGYVSTLRLDDPTVSGVQVLSVEGIMPTQANIEDDGYPLTRPLHLTTVGEPTGEAREFAQWVLGPGGQAVVDKLVNG
jgi:phosphate transport system substrate-binding protein